MPFPIRNPHQNPSSPCSSPTAPAPQTSALEWPGALGLPFHQQAFSSEQLEDAETQREKESVISRVFTAMGGTSYGGVDVGDVTAGQRDSYELVMENNRIVQDEARAGGVILGRNATVILAARPSTLHVKLDAPVRQRTTRAAQAAGIDLDRAAKRQKREDQFRADMSIQLYGWDPRETHRYDLVLNTGNLNYRHLRGDHPRRQQDQERNPHRVTAPAAARPCQSAFRIGSGHGCGGLQASVPLDRVDNG